MAVAPDLFTAANARAALSSIEETLLSPRQLGMKTLSPEDWAYRGNYDNNDNTSRETAKGWNYHQGPEWLWPYGYYLRARLRFFFTREELNNKHLQLPMSEVLMDWMRSRLAHHRLHLEVSKEKGLPELTNEQGKQTMPRHSHVLRYHNIDALFFLRC